MAPVSALLLPQHVLLDEFHLLCTRGHASDPALALRETARVATVACHTRASSATSRRGALSAPDTATARRGALSLVALFRPRHAGVPRGYRVDEICVHSSKVSRACSLTAAWPLCWWSVSTSRPVSRSVD